MGAVARGLRTLHVASVGQVGGAEKVLVMTLAHLPPGRVYPHVVCLDGGPLPERLERMHIATKTVHCRRFHHVGRTLRAIGVICRRISAWQIDLVHSVGSKAHVYGGLAALLTRRPSVWTMHDFPYPDPLVALAFRMPARAIMVPSNAVKAQVEPRARPGVPVVTVPNGIDCGPFAQANGTVFREELGLASQQGLVTMVGKLARGKGQEVFVEAAARVRVEFPHARFCIVGAPLFGLETDLPGDLARRVVELGLQSAVTLLGWREDVPAIMSASDVVVHASVSPEAFGLVVVEAMAAGKPVVATLTGGPEEIVRDGECGFLVPPGSSEAMAEAIASLLRDPARAAEMGRKGRDRARKDFSSDRMAREFEAVLRAVMNGSPAPDDR